MELSWMTDDTASIVCYSYQHTLQSPDWPYTFIPPGLIIVFLLIVLCYPNILVETIPKIFSRTTFYITSLMNSTLSLQGRKGFFPSELSQYDIHTVHASLSMLSNVYLLCYIKKSFQQETMHYGCLLFPYLWSHLAFKIHLISIY